MSTKKNFSHADYKIVKRDVLYQGVFKLSRYTLRHRLFNGGWTKPFEREVFERSSAVAIFPYDPVLDKVILIEQFRVGSLSDPESPWLIEIPAGIIEPDENPDEVAHREAMEETGCTLLELQPIVKYFVSPGASNEFLHLYYGRVDASNIDGIHGLTHEHEDIRVLNISSEQAFYLMDQGKIKNAPTLIGLLWLQKHKKKLIHL